MYDNCDYKIDGLIRIRLPFGFYLLRPHKSNRDFVWCRARSWMNKYFGTALEKNDRREMSNRKSGFEDGYLECLADLSIKLTYKKQQYRIVSKERSDAVL